MFIHHSSSLENYTRFQTKMAKVYNRFLTKRRKNHTNFFLQQDNLYLEWFESSHAVSPFFLSSSMCLANFALHIEEPLWVIVIYI